MKKVICFTNGGINWYRLNNLSNIFYFNFEEMTFVNSENADLSEQSYLIEGNEIPDYCFEIAAKEFSCDNEYVDQRLKIQEIEGF